MYKIGVMGEKDSVLGFKALGFSVFPVTSPEEAEKTLKDLAQTGYAVIYITEHVFEKLLNDIEEYKSRQLPAIIPIPGNQDSLGLGMKNIKKSVEKAVGADILSIE